MSDQAAPTPDPAGVARTPTGEISTQTQTTTPTATTPQTSTTATESPSLVNQPTESLANQQPAPQGAPETYADFAVPEGYELDKAVATEASTIFKEMNLTQAQAQKLVDFYTAKTTESANQPYQVWNDMQERWVREVKNDPVVGPRLAEVQTTISRAIDGLGDPKLAQEFRAAMDYTGAGNNPAFIKAFWKLAQKITEGSHVSGNGPSPAAHPNGGRPASAAQAMYPNLPVNR
jgi:hypothetical protein